ncbi:uncharacterized protein [Haliaeetus albicilla]|uniref:uncharacterized protein n=1 Tax=Haliaeetus albicilla TaxID=8969 RepID=UPI0037E7D555
MSEAILQKLPGTRCARVTAAGSSKLQGRDTPAPAPGPGTVVLDAPIDVRPKGRRGTALRPQLCLALDQLWVLSGGKEAAGEEKEEEEGSDEERTSIILIWPTGSCVAAFGTPGGAKRARVTRLPSLRPLEKELSRRHAVRHPKGGRHLDEQGHPLGSSYWTWFCGDPEPLLLPTAWRRAGRREQHQQQEEEEEDGAALALCSAEDPGRCPGAREMLAVLHKEGPSTEGVFRRAAGGTEFRELREALDHGADVDLGSQPALLLADFLRSIPAKLLVTDLYEDWMAAMQKSGKEEKVEELKAVAKKLPGANLLLLKRPLALLQHIGHNAASSRMTASNLAICLGPNLLSPPHEDLLPLEAMLAVTEKVNVLVEFMIDNCRELFGEQTTDLSCSAAEESSAAPTESWGELHLEEQSVPAVTADTKHQTEASLHAPPSLLGVLREAGGAMVVESERGEALPPTTPESAAEPLVRPEELANLSEERRFAGSPQDKEKKKNRKRKQAWGEESDRHAEKRRRKRENVFGDGPVRRCRKVQQVRKPRCVPGSAAHLSQLSALLQVGPTHWQGTARDGAAQGLEITLWPLPRGSPSSPAAWHGGPVHLCTRAGL